MRGTAGPLEAELPQGLGAYAARTRHTSSIRPRRLRTRYDLAALISREA